MGPVNFYSLLAPLSELVLSPNRKFADIETLVIKAKTAAEALSNREIHGDKEFIAWMKTKQIHPQAELIKPLEVIQTAFFQNFPRSTPLKFHADVKEYIAKNLLMDACKKVENAAPLDSQDQSEIIEWLTGTLANYVSENRLIQICRSRKNNTPQIRDEKVRLDQMAATYFGKNADQLDESDLNRLIGMLKRMKGAHALLSKHPKKLWEIMGNYFLLMSHAEDSNALAGSIIHELSDSFKKEKFGVDEKKSDDSKAEEAAAKESVEIPASPLQHPGSPNGDEDGKYFKSS